jgi:hypothetical protein
MVPFGCQTLFQNIVPSISFPIWETKRNHRGPSLASRGMGNDNHVIASHKLCGFQKRVSAHVVVMKEPVVVAPKFRSFSSHIFSQASQNVIVKVRVDCSVRRKKFTMNNPLHVEKKQ